MKQKLAKYISERLTANGVTQNFTVTGGGAMHLNDAFGHQKGMHCLYQHHEQACAMAAESYARIYNRPALLCVTSGPGGTNAITGVLGAYLDSLPMIVISGQVRYDNTARWSGVDIRALGDQEFDITRAVSCMTKYCEMLSDPYRVRYALEKALYLSQTGRPGPCWIDIPVNIQGSFLETDDLIGFSPEDYEAGGNGWAVKEGNAHILPTDDPCPAQTTTGDLRVAESQDRIRRERPVQDHDTLRGYAREILDRIRKSERPVFYTGNGIRIAGAEHLFRKLYPELNIPVVVGWNAPDIIESSDPLFAGRPGGRGDRPGNLAVQNADLILSIGSRLNIRQVGYNFAAWAKSAFVIVNDVDPEELRKPTVHADIRIEADAGDLMEALLEEIEAQNIRNVFMGGKGILRKDASDCAHTDRASRLCASGSSEYLNWLETCLYYRENYPTVLPEYFEDHGDAANVYALVDTLSELSEPGQITVVGNGSACVAGGQAYRIRRNARFISQDAVASMGYGLPAAIGAWAAAWEFEGEGERDTLASAGLRNPYWKGRREEYPPYSAHPVICLTGDGSIQMNLQELQTIIHHKMNIRIFVINNGGYHSIRQTQNSFFGKPLVGIGVDSGIDGHPDLSFPDLSKLAAAYGYPYVRIERNSELRDGIRKVLSEDGPVICEIFVTMTQQFLPKSAAKKLPDGSLVSPPLEDMAPFLPEEEMKKIMVNAGRSGAGE